MLHKWNEFILEFNRKDKEYIISNGDDLTIAIEYEICANEDPMDEPPVEDYDSAVKYVKDITILTVKRKLSYGHEFELTSDEINKFIDDILSNIVELYYEDETEDIYDDILNPELYDTETEKFIIETLSANVMRFMESQNMDYLKDRVKKHLPKFYKKYSNDFKYELEGDNDKERIIEFSPKSYLNGIEEAVEQLNMFFDEFEKQDYWYFNDRTSLHLNIGSNKKMNPLKGLLSMNDQNRDNKMPYVFKGIEHRFKNIHVGSMFDKLKSLLNNDLDKDEMEDYRDYDKLDDYKPNMIDNIDKLDLHNIEVVEDYINSVLLKSNIDFWVKEFGLNLTQYKNNNYVEFRFVGGDVKREVVLDKLYYFSYITYIMSNKDYKRSEYLKDLYKFVEELKNILKK
jgi:hypothetical protein